MRLTISKGARRFLLWLPFLIWAFFSAWASGFSGIGPMLFVGHWFLIPLLPVYLLWWPLISWLTKKDATDASVTTKD